MKIEIITLALALAAPVARAQTDSNSATVERLSVNPEISHWLTVGRRLTQ